MLPFGFTDLEVNATLWFYRPGGRRYPVGSTPLFNQYQLSNGGIVVAFG